MLSDTSLVLISYNLDYSRPMIFFYNAPDERIKGPHRSCIGFICACGLYSTGINMLHKASCSLLRPLYACAIHRPASLPRPWAAACVRHCAGSPISRPEAVPFRVGTTLHCRFLTCRWNERASSS